MSKTILDLIDFTKVDTLLEGFNKSTGFVTAILDLDGNILSKSGWRQVCTEFHRIHPETSKKCTISDTELAGKLTEGENYHFYKCLNGLVDVAVPIIINEEHIANLFSGQLFFEKPDTSFFKKQAAKYGFDETKYLKALEKVPVVSKEKVLTAMNFLLNMTQLISEMTLQTLQQAELNSTIRESEEKFKSVFESANVGKSITLPTGEIYVNEALCKMLGYTREELQNKKWQDITPQDEIPIIQKQLETMLNGNNDSVRFERRYICKNGTYIWVDVSVSIRPDDIGKPLYFIATIIDITERKRVEDERQKFVMLAESSSEFIGMCDLDYKPIYVNPAGVRLVGLPDLESACRIKVQDYFFPEDQQFMIEEFFPRVFQDGHGDVEIRLRHFQTGKAIWMFYYLFRVHDASGTAIGWATVSRNITKQKQADEAIIKSLQEKETLIREIYHRTRNTMQIIKGIIVLQAAEYPSNPDIDHLIKNTENRIQAISLVHKMLYQSQDLSQISIKEYIISLTSLLTKSFCLSKERILFTINVVDNELLLDTAIPLGLFLNELITNSIKYAFPHNRNGIIDITLTLEKSGNYLLKYSDNGVGVPEGFDLENRDSLGLKLIYSIGEEQMLGKVIMKNKKGVTCSLEFPCILYKARI